MSYDFSFRDEQVVGKMIARVHQDREHFGLVFADGTSKLWEVEGDCCSSTWIEHVEIPADIVGATLTAIRESDSVRDTIENGVDEHGESHECLQFYQTFFETDRGAISVEFRNSSNGYYGVRCWLK